MTRRYRYAKPHERDERAERRQAAAQAARQELRWAIPVEARDDNRQPGYIRISLGGVVIDWTLRPDRRNVRRWGAFNPDGSPVLIDGAHLTGGKDKIGRAALDLLPRYIGLRNLC